MNCVNTKGARTALALAMVLLMPALAGCIGTAQATAMEEEDTARERAQEWDSEVLLTRIFGMEGHSNQSYDMGDRDRQGDHWQRVEDDENIGDGHAELWLYRYISPNKPGQAYVVVVDRDGEVLHEESDQRDEEDRPVGSFEVDSDEAVDKAMEVNDGLRKGLESENHGLFMTLGKDDDRQRTVWFIAGGGGDHRGGGGGMVVVDAVTGEVLANQGGYGMGDMDWDMDWDWDR